MRRGQAFETMMLVISVIVAIAILGVLLNILGGLSFGASKPAAVINDGLKEISTKGYGVTQPKETAFEPGTTILSREVIDGTTIQPSEMRYSCKATGDFCRSFILTGKIETTATTKVKAFITVCGDDTAGIFCVGLGRQPGDSKDTCIQTCRLS